MSMSPINLNEEQKKWDRTGILLSSLCALHCLVTPFISLSLPLWVYSIHYSPVHLAIALFIFPVAVYSFWAGFKKHESKTILLLGGLGLFLLCIALIGPSSRNQLRWNDIMTLMGSFLLVAAHALNFRSLRKISAKN
ncbi:MerC domain-containing protein [Bdellovibrio sp. HCB337]|uniref:MerC domain-containing protein n=1 Tax=Bdellovibrio sp. HCB337 TaxID=3394358 RepID=UPI0039A47710